VSSKKGLGRGFDSLIPTDLLDDSFDPTSDEDNKVSVLRMVSIGRIYPDPDQPRKKFDQSGIDELALSIKEHGIIQPLIITPDKDGKYQIVAGERRYRAAKQARLGEVPAIVRSLTGQKKLELSLIENLQRRDLNVMETATAYAKLRDQFNLTLEDIGKRVGGKALSSISNTLRLLKLPDFVKQELADGKITEGQARPLINLEESLQKKILPRIIEEEWSARKIESYIASLKKEKEEKTKNTLTPSDTKLTSEIKERIKLPVKIHVDGNGTRQIIISLKNEKDIEKLRDIIGF
jgi:ParB family chromosome partitioning protein